MTSDNNEQQADKKDSQQTNAQTSSTYPYTENPDGKPDGIYMWRKKKEERGEYLAQLTNFTARIVGDVVEDDGAETKGTVTIEGTFRNRTHTFTITLQRLNSLDWVSEYLGVGASVLPGYTNKEYAAYAIRSLSGNVPRQDLYTHTGWRKLASGAWVYLHGGGAVVSNVSKEGDVLTTSKAASIPDAEGGVVSNVSTCQQNTNICFPTVRLEKNMERFALPPVGELAELRAAVRAELRLLGLGPDSVMVPVFGAIWRAPLGSVDTSIHLVGASGQFKTEVAALAQQHFGAGFDARHLPANWTFTVNALEDIAFKAKDAVLVVDEFKPTGGVNEVQKYHANADRIFRGAGNAAGRARLTSDLRQRAARYPRCLIISTGEDTVRSDTDSLRARLVEVFVSRGAIPPAKLSACQKDAREGLYALAMAGYLEWLAPRFDGEQRRLQAKVDRIRDAIATDDQHRRTAPNFANLLVGIFYFLVFALDIGAISAEEAAKVWEQSWKALLSLATTQSTAQTEQEPTERYRELLVSALADGQAHIAPVKRGDIPAGLWPALGYDSDGVIPGASTRIGWFEGDDLYLEPNNAHTAVLKKSHGTGQNFSVSPDQMKKLLHDKGLLKSRDEVRRTHAVRKTIGGQQQKVLHLDISFLNISTTTSSEQDADIADKADKLAPAAPKKPEIFWPEALVSRLRKAAPAPDTADDADKNGRIVPFPEAA